MPKTPTQPSLKELREQLERAQIEAEIKQYTEAPKYESVQALTPRTRVFVYRTEFLESEHTMLKMTASLKKAMNDENIAIVNVANGSEFREI
jgi:predicted membrane chloride channel (bestrophin family)